MFLAALPILIAACASAPPGASPSAAAGGKTSGPETAPADPAQWIGRWTGSHGATLQITQQAGHRYRLDIRSDQGVTTHYSATSAGSQLFFQRLGQSMAVRPGRAADANDPSLSHLTDCLTIVPGHQTFCRRVNTADALPLATGAYVAVKTACNAASPAATLFFDGQAFARPGQSHCHASLIGQQGMIFRLHDSCAASGTSASGGTADETVNVPDAHHLALTPKGGATALYRYCASGLLPPALRAQAPK